MWISHRTFRGEKTSTKILRQKQICSAVGKQRTDRRGVRKGKCGCSFRNKSFRGFLLSLNVDGKPLECLSRDYRCVIKIKFSFLCII